MKYFINKGFTTQKYYIKYDALPYIRLWFTKHHFLETGVTSPAAGLYIGWLKWSYQIIIQKGY